ncbi:MAG: oligoendopeptidase F [Candidatus Thermofonsia Clade 1 bacterium]|uniref:Oligoendopeptidase F n=1 Tax=Candidatus Thermofonsia Clade 1 bacterium TaxID=2364210 RepID=A0A2M8Q0G5_9CHLR|nr:MAG: oligoendopeptidase F [Candidatus Thermofonsia Clade 1 bacterium]
MNQTTGAENVIWDLSIFYASPEDSAISRDLTDVQAQAERFAEHYHGRVASLSAAELAEALGELEAIYEKIGKLSAYAHLHWTTNTADPVRGALLQRVREADSKLDQTLLFFMLEWTHVSEEGAKVADAPALSRYRHYLRKQLRYRPHLLSEAEEKILNEKAVTGRDAWARFFTETVSSIRYEWEGQQVPQSLVMRQLYAPERDVRKRAADSITAGLRPHLRTLTFVFNTLLADKASEDRLRKYPTWLSARNLANETTDEAVQALVSAVTSRYDIVSRYYGIKRRLLGLDELFDYDRYAMLPSAQTHYTWEAARNVVLDAFGAFSPRMAEIAREFFEHNWIHAPVMPNKSGGAFASPTVPSAHPFILVNYTGAVRDVMTLAHELGHGIHMYLSRPHGIFGAYTPLTTAEMASVFGEMLVFNNLMARENDPSVRLTMLASKIEDTFATVFRQISMNRFEEAVHTARRTEGELSTERLNALWLETQRAMFGESLTLRDDYAIWWSYVPHFVNTPGYVYAYAFGELLVLALFSRYKQEGASFVPRYFDVLSSGGSDSPENILAKAGVDLNDPNFWQQGLQIIDDMVSDLEALTVQVQ